MTEDSPRGGTHMKGGRINTETGAELTIDGDQPMEVEGSVQQTDVGAAFGPLEIAPYPDSSAVVGGLRFLEVEGFFDRLFGDGEQDETLFGTTALAAGTATAAADEDVDVDMGRRNLLQGLGVGALAVVGGSRLASAQTTKVSKRFGKAQFNAEVNPDGLRIRVRDRVEGVLPTDTEYYTFVDSVEYSRFFAGVDSDYGDVLPGQFGTVTVGPEDAAGGIYTELTTDKTQVYEGLPLSKPTTDASAGERLVISQNDILVEYVQRAGEDETTLAVNGTSIPHYQEDDESTLGYYRVHNGALIYRVGRQAPSAQSATLVLFVDPSDELLDDITREVQ